MSARATLIFWVAVAAAVLLLGSVFFTIRRIAEGGGAGDYAVLALASLPLAAVLFVAGRIVLAVGRAQRRGRPD